MPEFTGPVTHVELANVPLWLIVLFPFLGAVTNAIFGRRLQRSDWMKDFSKRHHIGSAAVSAVAVGVMVCAFLLVCVNFWQLLTIHSAGERYVYTHAWQMVRIGSLDINFSFAMDPLSALMAMIVTGVGSLIHIYATSYMEDEKAYWRFFCYLNLFIFSMLLLILGDNFIVMFFGWEGVGLCSYLLIGFWYQDYNKASAGMKAFVVNRVGDWGFICGMALLFWGLGGTWLAQTGEFAPDYNARFMAVHVEEQAHGHEAGHGVVPRGAADAHGKADGRGHGDDHGRPKPTTAAELLARSKMTGLLTMTTHPGARVYFNGVTDAKQLRDSRLPDCRDTPMWDAAEGEQIAASCYAVSPFIQKRLSAAGKFDITIMPGDGAVVSGDGDTIALLRGVKMRSGKELLLAPAGPTLTFRELHDQLVIKDASGQTFLKKALQDKTVWGGMALVTVACICFFIGAAGKSAQIPLYVWLPDAMAGPTPVSALIHAATMVTAGVYMVARMNFLFSLSPNASGVVALVGALTALFAATMGFFQYDIKRVLAYSTVSQLGFMFIGVGVGAYWAGVFHLMTHAFFKACLFLGSGSVIHGMHHFLHDDTHAQDMRHMGGLRAVMPDTAKTYKIACFAISAAYIPFFAGFWSKDEILWKAFNTQNTGFVPGWLIYLMGLVAALGTSFYMWRSYYLTFEGKHAHRRIKFKVHESPKVMTHVLWVLAFLSTVGGVVFGLSSHFTLGVGEGILPHEPLLEQWLHPVMAHSEATFSDAGGAAMWALMALSVFGAIGLWGVAQRRYGADRPNDWVEREQRLPGFYWMHNKYFVDEFYQATVIKAFMKLRLIFAEMDRWIVDGIVNSVGVIGRSAAWITGAIDHYIVDGAVNAIANGTLKAGGKLRTYQTGRIQNYIYGILGGVVVLAFVQYFLE